MKKVCLAYYPLSFLAMNLQEDKLGLSEIPYRRQSQARCIDRQKGVE